MRGYVRQKWQPDNKMQMIRGGHGFPASGISSCLRELQKLVTQAYALLVGNQKCEIRVNGAIFTLKLSERIDHRLAAIEKD